MRQPAVHQNVTRDNDHGRESEPGRIGAGDFKATCLKALDEVARTRQPLIITKRGKPVATLMPMPPRSVLFGALAGSVLRMDDIESPVDEPWDADRWRLRARLLPSSCAGGHVKALRASA